MENELYIHERNMIILLSLKQHILMYNIMHNKELTCIPQTSSTHVNNIQELK